MSDLYEFDIEGFVMQSHLNPAPSPDPIKAVEVITDWMTRPGFSREKYCAACKAWDDPLRRTTSNTRRPPGTMDREACNGCIMSFVDQKQEHISVIRDRLFNEWAEAKAKLSEHEAKVQEAQLPKDKKRWHEARARMERSIKFSFEACKLAGFDPTFRSRRSNRSETRAEKA